MIVKLYKHLSWSTHIDNITKSENQTLGFLKRNIRVHYKDLKSVAYKTLVRPQLEHASPHTATDIQKYKQSMRDFHLELVQSSLATTDVQSLWDKFATRLQLGIDKFIPVWKAGTRDGFPWINQEIRRLIRKRDKLYKRWPRSGRPYEHNKFLEQKHPVRRISERAYEKYLGDILGLSNERDDQNMKIWENPQRSKQRNSTSFSSTPSRTPEALLP